METTRHDRYSIVYLGDGFQRISINRSHFTSNPMNKNGPIIIIEDDLDDQDILATVCEKKFTIMKI